MSLFDRDRSAARMPVSLVTGFLGSGKTTLINRLLRHPGMAATLVVVNEFGDVGLDHLLYERVDGETVLMQSGCVCCTVRSDLETTLRDIAAKRAKGALPPFERVLIETTGLADPAPIVQLLLNHPLTAHDFRLDAVITTVDAVHGARQLDEHREPVKQAAIADRLLITKADLATADQMQALRLRLGFLNPGAGMHEVRHGAIEPERLFGAALFDPARKTADVRRWLNAEAYDAPVHAHDLNRHGTDIESFCLAFDEPLDWQAVHDWLAAIRRERGEDLLRVKGILNLAGESAPVAIHGVHHVFHPPVQLEAWPEGDDRRSRIVFIMRGLDRAAIAESFASFCIRAAA
ncbi:CobW family GTP-binding protein [Desertibaculum subflavum]|uniref:CobW family GTP-binding protein n=1 Tax=Desertibaculum subflavum TaxID=2268458 RepID=UPI000E6610E2